MSNVPSILVIVTIVHNMMIIVQICVFTFYANTCHKTGHICKIAKGY